MNREQKAAEIEGLKRRFSKAQVAILADYKGIGVSAVTDLRAKLRGRAASMKVLKNRLAQIAAKGTPCEPLAIYFKDTTALITSETDAPGAAKILVDFAKDNEKLVIKSGYLGGRIIKAGEVKALSALPSREALIAQLMGSLNAPMTNLASVLVQIPRRLVQVLAAVRDRKEKGV